MTVICTAECIDYDDCRGCPAPDSCGCECHLADRLADEVEDDDETAHSDEHGVCVACGNCAICFDYDGGGCFDGSAHTVFEDLK